MTDLALNDDCPLFWELVNKYGKRLDESPWSPELLETTPVPDEETRKALNWPVTFRGALDYTRRLVAAQYATQALPLLALDTHAQHVDLDDALLIHVVEEAIQGVLVDD